MDLLDLINNGWNVKIWTIVKRLGDLNNRHWESRIVYLATKGKLFVESKWEGFTKSQDAINDIYKKIKEL